MIPIQILSKARAIIAKPENWFQGEEDGNCTLHEAMTQSCASLAMLDAAEDMGSEAYGRAQDILETVMGGCMVKFNATHTHQQVIEAFDRAIERAAMVDCLTVRELEPA